MAAVRDSLCNIGPLEIPRPKCEGFQFIPTRGRMGFYRSIKRDGGKYGLKINTQGPRRPALPDAFIRSTSVENGQENAQNIPEPPKSAPPMTSMFQRQEVFINTNGNSAAKPPLPPNRFNGQNNVNNRYVYQVYNQNVNGYARPAQSPHGISPLAMGPLVAEPEITVPEPDYDTSDNNEPPKSSRASSISRKSSENGSIERKIENSLEKNNQKVTFVSEKF
uniref:Uncharacterized protein n=1 Tax=Acrobeloides nanus TaxID=290746 RepID=A0A914EAX0_9BILA